MKKLFYGGDILTLTDTPAPEAVLTENGKIVDLGNLSLFDTPDCEKINLNGFTLMPAFIDAHSHFTQTAVSFLQASVNGAKSFGKIKEKIEKFVTDNGVAEGEWVTACDYDNNLFPDSAHLTLDEVESLLPRNPLVIKHKSGHSGFVNSLGARELGRGESAFYAEEDEFFSLLKKTPAPSKEKLQKAFQSAQEKYLSHGITVIQEGMATAEVLPYLTEACRDLTADLRIYPDINAYFKAKKLFNSEKAKVSGVKIFLDGSPQSKTAFVKTPYLDGSFGTPTMTKEQVLSAMEWAARQRVQLIAHCNGDGAIERFLSCLEKTEEKYPDFKNCRPVIIHAQLMTAEQTLRAARLGAVISFFIAHIKHWGDVHIKNLGYERAKLISPANSALKNGAVFTFHQDTPVIDPDMLETAACAVERKTDGGTALAESEKISVYDALLAVTANSAYQYFEENTRGKIAKGMAADFVLLSENPLKAQCLEKIKVLKTYKNAQCVFEKS